MFLRAIRRHKDGKAHRYFSVVENRRLLGDRVVQRQVLYLGEINDSQEASWRKTLEVFDEDRREYRDRRMHGAFPVVIVEIEGMTRSAVKQCRVHHRCLETMGYHRATAIPSLGLKHLCQYVYLRSC